MARKKPRGIGSRIRAKKEAERQRAVAIFLVLVLLIVVAFSSFLVQSLSDQFSGPTTDLKSMNNMKAAIVDHVSLTFPNQTFKERATTILEQAGYLVDYFPGEEVTVNFYRDLPKRGYEILVLRVHSTAAAFESGEFPGTPVSFFTSENYSQSKYLLEQLTDQIVGASYIMPQPPYYFAITPKFVISSMNGKFQDTTIIMMGCEGLNNTKMAEAFVQKGAKVYIGWTGPISSRYTDQATARLLQHLIAEGQTIERAIDNTIEEVGPDRTFSSELRSYPP